MRPDPFQLYGQAKPPPSLTPLRAGPLSLLYDPATAMLRHIKFGEREVWRGLYAAVRDRNWGTVPGLIQETKRTITSDSFRIEFTSVHQRVDIHFVWRGIINGSATGEISYTFDGEAKTTFLRNRIGFCLLHPIAECAGAHARQTRIDGSMVDCRFPDLIEPQIFGRSSFQQLRAVAHAVTPDVWAEATFDGDLFEMEDQRNWTDASFKTYCTPLALPFPVEIQAGSRVHQEITLRLNTKAHIKLPAPSTTASSNAQAVTVTIPDHPTGTLPAIGLGTASHDDILTPGELAQLKRLKLSHLRMDVKFSESNTITRLTQAAQDAPNLGVALELALHLPRRGEADPQTVLRALEKSKTQVVRILALREGEAATSEQTLTWVQKHFGQLHVPIGAGSDSNFCELNRERHLGKLAQKSADGFFWSINPQVHAIDPLSIMETLEAQPATVRTARAFAGDRPLIISPLTLKQRFNPVATQSASAKPTNELPATVDPRQLSKFAAAWTLGSLIALAGAGVQSVTYYETTGWRGVMERESGSPLPAKFPSTPGMLFPLFEVFAQVAGFREFASAHSNGREVTALALFENGALKRLLIANLTDQPQQVNLSGATGGQRTFYLSAYSIVTSDDFK